MGKYLNFEEREHDGKLWECALRVHPDTVTIVPFTKKGKLLLVKQYRPGIGAYTLEFPAGLYGDNENNESLRQTAIRELLEETGYQCPPPWENFQELTDALTVSGGFSNETSTIFVAYDCEKVTTPEAGIEVFKFKNNDGLCNTYTNIVDFCKENNLKLDMRVLAALWAVYYE